MLTAPNACPAIHGNAFLLAVMVFRIQTQNVATEAEELFSNLDQIQRNLLSTDRLIQEYGAAIERLEKVIDAYEKGREDERRRRRPREDEYWKRRADWELIELKCVLMLGATMLMRMAYDIIVKGIRPWE